MKQPIYVVDAFTERPFAGNPAAVCPLAGPREAAWMQSVAAEMNLSITAFLERRAGSWGLRWFTRKAEIDLCGHGTLASAHLLWETGELDRGDEARFDTRSGRVTVRRAAGDDGAMEMDFPERRESAHPPVPELFSALGAEPAYFGKNAYDYFAVFEREADIRRLAPDIAALRKLPMRGVIVTAAADPGSGFDFVSRFFAPGVGIDEDPVTGSAHCCLGPFWSERLGKRELVGYQASQRGGVVRVRVDGERVLLGGKAVTIIAGEIVASG
jgi:PhzF family phenazine biosynthesis protein